MLNEVELETMQEAWEDIKQAIRFGNLKPVRYWGYTSHVQISLLHINRNNKREAEDARIGRFINEVRAYLDEIFKESGIKYLPDNKCVWILASNSGEMAIGIYDWSLSIGIGRYGDSWIKPKEIVS